MVLFAAYPLRLRYATLPAQQGWNSQEDDVLNFATVGPIAVYLPEKVESNEHLRAQFPKWDMDLIYSKTGIATRHIAAANEYSSDLGVAAAERLFREYDIDRQSIDFLMFCTQTPDYPLPTTACLIQDRLKLPKTCGALDFNLGCSGFVYGLSLADGLIRAGSARRVLLITAETYSKYIDEEDRSLRTIFGDGAAATLIEASPQPDLSAFCFGTDGSGGDMLLVTEGGLRKGDSALKPRKRHRWNSALYMDGPGLIYFTLEMIPELVSQVLERSKLAANDIDMYLMHQPTKLLLDQLRDKLGLESTRMPMLLKNCGNTVSSTIPLVIRELRQQGQLRPGTRSMLVGFGVGLSWAACLWEERWSEPR